jgi:hypothetical protein
MRRIAFVGVLLAAARAHASVEIVSADPLPAGLRTSFDGVTPPGDTAPFTVALRGAGAEVAALVQAIGVTHWLHRCAEGDCRIHSWAAGNAFPSGSIQIDFTPAVRAVALRIDDCVAPFSLTVTVVGSGGSEVVSATCQPGMWILARDRELGSVSQLRVWASYGGAFDDLTVEPVPAAPAELALSASAARPGPTATLSFVARHLAGAAAPGARLSVLLPAALRGTTAPADVDGVIHLDAPLTPGQMTTHAVTAAPARDCEAQHLVVGVLREGVESDIDDNIAATSFGRDPTAVAPREDCAAEGDEDCDGFHGCSDRDCLGDEACEIRTPDILDGNPPDPAPPLLPLVFPPPVPLPAPAPDTVCTVFINGVATPAPAYCCQGTPKPDSPFYARFFLDCPPRDPNFKESTPPAGASGIGWTRAGERIAYVLHYENIGASDAHDVQVIDVLDADLDASTLEIAGGGRYDPATRTLVWVDPVVFPRDPRHVEFAVRVRADAPPGTRVRNLATIVFPDAVPPTRIDTNLVEHVIPLPAHSLAPRLFVPRCVPAGAASLWRVHLANWGLSSAYNARVRALSAPSGVQIVQGEASGFAHPADVLPAAMASVVPFGAAVSAGSVEIVAPTAEDPCPRIAWEIAYQEADGAARTVTSTTAACEVDCGEPPDAGPPDAAPAGAADAGVADAPVATAVDARMDPITPGEGGGCGCRAAPAAPATLGSLLLAGLVLLVTAASATRPRRW